MLRLAAVFGMALGSALMASAAIASDFQIRVSVKSGGHETKTDRTDEDPPRGRKQTRPVMEIERNAPIVLMWHAENLDKSEAYEDLLMHFFVVEEKQVGQTAVPKLSTGVVYEGALTADFKPHDKTDWHMTLKIPEAGNYLVRVETIGMALKGGLERYAAMDLIVR
jgi:hypothetical protein